MKRRRPERFGDLVSPSVDARRKTANVEYSADRREPGLHHPGRQVAGRTIDEDAIDVGETPQRDPLVRDAVLQTKNWRLGRRDICERVDRGSSVLRLHRQKHDIVLRPGHGRRTFKDR